MSCRQSTSVPERIKQQSLKGLVLVLCAAVLTVLSYQPHHPDIARDFSLKSFSQPAAVLPGTASKTGTSAGTFSVIDAFSSAALLPNFFLIQSPLKKIFLFAFSRIHPHAKFSRATFS
jgi:hypothetical protein